MGLMLLEILNTAHCEFPSWIHILKFALRIYYHVRSLSWPCDKATMIYLAGIMLNV